jgi:hypothetical protein
MMKNFLLFFCLISTAAYSQPYTIDARITPREILSGHLKMGNPGPTGSEILLNNKYITIGGKPVVPVMGEFHFSRYPKEQWEDVILKMKANGTNIIATYVFWIHHEEIEGQFDWSGNKDFRSFIKLCQKHGLYVYPRIGPWCHGEVRNGGTPDWIFDKKNMVDRTNQPEYQFYADRLYKNIALQMEGLYYKDGGPIIGIQLENEYRRGPGGNEHIVWLKKTALKYGIDVPMYTVTGWGNVSVPQDEVIPLFGGYPEEPWDTNIEKSKENLNFTFEAPINDEGIGADVAGKEGKSTIDYTRYPYLTCEIGIGNQISYHRRPILNQYDGLAIATAKIGSGSNLPGYYVFAGGSNPIGTYTTMEENQDETGYWNEYPDISYDFQAAIKETGELAPSYHQVKKLHYFLNEFGDRLAPMLSVIPKDQKSKEALQWAIRVKDNTGFVFGMNYYRGVCKPLQKGVQLNITLPSETMVFPSKPIDVPDSCIFIWPFNFNMDGTLLKYATAQPLCKINQKDRTDWFFIQNLGIIPEFCIDTASVESIAASNGKVSKKQDRFIITDIKPGFTGSIKIKTKSGKLQNIVVLSFDEANKSWFFENNGKKQLFVSDANLYLHDNKLFLYGPSNNMSLVTLSDSSILPSPKINILSKAVGPYTEYSFQLPPKKIELSITKKEVLDDALWLKSSVSKVNAQNELYHKVFAKEFTLGNPSPIKAATLYLYCETPGKMEINRNWLNQEIEPGKINQIDITGYLQKGANTIMTDFPFTQGDYAFAAKIVVEYFNSDKLEITTDLSWLMAEVYTLPAPWGNMRNAKAPEVVAAKPVNYGLLKQPNTQWVVKIPNDYLSGLNNAYLSIDYTGDMGRCRLGYRLVSDNYFNGTPWQMQLKQFGNQLEGKELNFEILPLKPGYKIYFENGYKPKETGNININKISVVPEYVVQFGLQ